MASIDIRPYLEHTDPAMTLIHDAALDEAAQREQGWSESHIAREFRQKYRPALCRLAIHAEVGHVLPPEVEQQHVPDMTTMRGLQHWGARVARQHAADGTRDARERAFKD